ncbi:MAG: alkaline phosphatase PhoX [Longimicrobiales bacterium]
MNRRSFLRHAAWSGGLVLTPSLSGLVSWAGLSGRTTGRGPKAVLGSGGYGPLIESANCPEFWIPRGFECVRLSTTYAPSTVNPNLQVPPALDGMATFALPDGNIRLIRNHEVADGARAAAPIGHRPYDARAGGGTTSLDVRITPDGEHSHVELIAEFVSLSGTHINCAGGHTPWGSWLSCEETTSGPSSGFERKHGYIFEVPVSADGEVEPVPLTAMGRFVHEAVAVDPNTRIVYETEDAWWVERDPDNSPGAGFYRFIPDTADQLAAGGRLEMLAIAGSPNHDLIRGQHPGVRLPVSWVAIDEPDPESAEQDRAALFRAGREKGAARFQRLEGCFWGDDGIYIVSTNGGDAAAGQIWFFRPDGDGGELHLVFESPSRDVLEGPDNICTSPRGGLIICEDAVAEQYVRGLTPDGQIVDLVLAPAPLLQPEPTEFAGCCFSPDGQVLFFNVQGGRTATASQPGATYAIWGPWATGAI